MSSPRAKPNAAAKSQKKTELAKRRLDITELLLLRLAQCQIAEKLELSEASVSETVREIRADWAERHKEKVDVLQARELAALDADETRVRKWLAGTTPAQDRARGKYLELLLKIMERRSKLIGLDAPTKIEQKVEATGDEVTIVYQDNWQPRVAAEPEPAPVLTNGNGANGAAHG